MEHFLAFLKPDETAAQLLARTHVEPISTSLPFASTLRQGQILEVSGPSGTAKSEILQQVRLEIYKQLSLGNFTLTIPFPAGHCHDHPAKALEISLCWRQPRCD